MIRRIRLDEADSVARIYATEYAPGVQEGPIVTWLQNCALHACAFCLVDDRGGFVIASLTESPVLPLLGGELEELHARDADQWLDLARAAIERLQFLGAATIRADVAHDEDHGSLLETLGFESEGVYHRLYRAEQGAQ